MAIGIYFLGNKTLEVLDAQNQILEQTKQQAPPEPVAFLKNMALADGEIALQAKVDPAIHDYYYLETRDGATEFEYFYFLRGLEEDGAGKDLSAVIIFETNDPAKVEAWFDQAVTKDASGEAIFEIRGIARSTALLAEETATILADHDAQVTENFTYIYPFIDGRDAYFANASFDIETLELALWGVIAACLIFPTLRSFITRLLPNAPSALDAAEELAVDSASISSDLDEPDAEFTENLREETSNPSELPLAAKQPLLRRLLGRKKLEVESEEIVEIEESKPTALHLSHFHPDIVVDGIAVYTPPRAEFLPEDIVDNIYASVAQRSNSQAS